jgi:hypothetical protein
MVQSNDKVGAGEIEVRDMEDGEATPLKEADESKNKKLTFEVPPPQTTCVAH